MARGDWKRPSEFPLEKGKRRIRLDISYDGANFSGWQRQKGRRTVQQTIEEALAVMLKEEIHVHGSGRTDAKVHALAQVAHFDTVNQSVPSEVFTLALNQRLPHDIRLTHSKEVTEKFHARFTAIEREYRYMVKLISDYTPFDRNRVARIRRFAPLELLNAYAACCLGTHNFTTFGSSADQSHSKIRDLYMSEFFWETSEWGGKILVYKVSGNAFLMHQVRSMVGTMLQLGEQEALPAEFARRLAAQDRLMALRTAAPEGLYLYRIAYDQDE
ncbi:MAG: tRNA pseudouridine(38-40) synthase TruA [Sphaerochaetaceae bacterium]|jgi:tRNA pseudouridine38-40 synthase